MLTGGLSSFRDLFKDYLESRIGLGGDVDEMVTLVTVYQGGLPATGTEIFRDWVENELFLCERCEHEFRARAADVKEDDPVLCQRCLAWQRGYDEGRQSGVDR